MHYQKKDSDQTNLRVGSQDVMKKNHRVEYNDKFHITQ